jgi:hypothetical protein
MRSRQSAAANTFGRALQSTMNSFSSLSNAWNGGTTGSTMSGGTSKPVGAAAPATESVSGVIPDMETEGYGNGPLWSSDQGPKYKHGGLVRGPGTGTSDSVPAVIDGKKPARLSAGEFVIPEKAVRFHGTKVFKKLIEEAEEGKPHG